MRLSYLLHSLDDAEKHLEEIHNALIAQYSDEYDYEELSSDIAVQEGLTAYLRDTNSQGDNRDTSYLMTKDFTLNSDEDFVVVYGVNHTATGKACYSNAVLYARPMLNGVCSVYDSLFSGSADLYLETDCEDADGYYVYKMARTKMDDYTKIIEYSTGNEKGKYYGVDNGNTLLLAFRAYVDETDVGPSYYEIVYDRAIIFHKKQFELICEVVLCIGKKKHYILSMRCFFFFVQYIMNLFDINRFMLLVQPSLTHQRGQESVSECIYFKESDRHYESKYGDYKEAQIFDLIEEERHE